MKSDPTDVGWFSDLLVGAVITGITMDEEAAHVDLEDGRTLIFYGFGDIAVTEVPDGSLQ